MMEHLNLTKLIASIITQGVKKETYKVALDKLRLWVFNEKYGNGKHTASQKLTKCRYDKAAAHPGKVSDCPEKPIQKRITPMLSPIDYYLPEVESIQETNDRYVEHVTNERYDGEWEAMTAPYGVFADKSPEWWEGFLTALARRNGVNVAVLTQPTPCNDDWF